MKSAAVMIAAIVALALGGAAQAGSSQSAASSLARQIAWTAASAEHGAGQQSQIRPAVQMAVQGLIVSSGAEPKIVVAALDQALASCKPIGTSIAEGWTCPASSDAYAALMGLRGVVVASLGDPEPAAGDGQGPSPFSTTASVEASANYSAASQ